MSEQRPMRLVILIPSLEIGGAERQAIVLAGELAALGNEVHLVTFYPGGPLASQAAAGAVEFHCLEKPGRWDLGAAFRFFRLLGRIKPDVVYTWLPQTNVWAALPGLVRRPTRLVWSVRDAGVLSHHVGVVQRLVLLAEARLARTADLIIANSQAGQEYAIARGFPPEKIRVVSNAVDVSRMATSPESRMRIREEWALTDSFVVGTVGRLDPIKDHATFLRAAALAVAKRPDMRFLIVGGGTASHTAHLRELARDLGVESRVCWVGARLNVPEFLAALDLFSLTSIAEGFPNSLAEAMAAGLPCVATSVGDCARVLGSNGAVVPSGDPTALCSAWLALAARPSAERSAIGTAAKERVSRLFTPAAAARNTVDLFERLFATGD